MAKRDENELTGSSEGAQGTTTLLEKPSEDGHRSAETSVRAQCLKYIGTKGLVLNRGRVLFGLGPEHAVVGLKNVKLTVSNPSFEFSGLNVTPDRLSTAALVQISAALRAGTIYRLGEKPPTISVPTPQFVDRDDAKKRRAEDPLRNVGHRERALAILADPAKRDQSPEECCRQLEASGLWEDSSFVQVAYDVELTNFPENGRQYVRTFIETRMKSMGIPF